MANQHSGRVARLDRGSLLRKLRVVDLFAVGYGDLQPKLNKLSKEGKWDELATYIDDDFVDAFSTRGKPEDIAAQLKDKYGSFANRLAIYAPYGAPDDMWRKIIAELKN